MGNPRSNTRDCFRELVGKRVVGVIFDALPRRGNGLNEGTTTLVIDDGRGLSIGSNGSYWLDNAEDVKVAVMERKRHLDSVQREIAEVIVLSGVLT